MAYTTQYIGSRYVPIFADPIEWNSIRTYEPLTIVMHDGNSYTSRQYVPVGIEITNEKFWALTGNYNAQVEQYRKEVMSFDGRMTANANAIEAETTNRTTAVTEEKNRAIITEDSIKMGYSRVCDTVESMKNDTTIKKGMVCKTIGYRAVNDLGGGVYKINTDASNGYEKISVSNNLTASLVIENNTVNVDGFGVYGDNEHNDADVLNYAVTFCCDNGITLTMSAKHYKINHGIVLNDRKQNGVNIQGQGVYKTYITTDSNIVMFRADTLIRCNIGGFNIESSNSNSTCFRCDIKYIIGVEHQEAKDAYDEMENIQRYKLYTAEQLKERQAAKERAQKREEFMTTGPNRLSTAETDIDTITANIDDIITLMADMIGVV